MKIWKRGAQIGALVGLAQFVLFFVLLAIDNIFMSHQNIARQILPKFYINMWMSFLLLGIPMIILFTIIYIIIFAIIGIIIGLIIQKIKSR